MRRIHQRMLKRTLVVLLSGSCLWQLGSGCTQALQREIEVLIRPEANPTLIRQSWLVDVFGPRILNFW